MYENPEDVPRWYDSASDIGAGPYQFAPQGGDNERNSHAIESSTLHSDTHVKMSEKPGKLHSDDGVSTLAEGLPKTTTPVLPMRSLLSPQRTVALKSISPQRSTQTQHPNLQTNYQ